MGKPASQHGTQKRWIWVLIYFIVIITITPIFLVLGIIALWASHFTSFSDWLNFLYNMSNLIGSMPQWLILAPNIKKVWHHATERIKKNENESVASKPHNVPNEQQFIGHQHLLLRIKDTCKKVPYRTVIGGTSGTGKSMLALTYAHDRNPSHYSDVFWIHASSTQEIQESCFNIQRDLNQSLKLQVVPFNPAQQQPRHPSSPNPQAAIDAVIKWLRDPDNSSWLLVLDGYCEPVLLDDDIKEKEYSQIIADFLSLRVDAQRHFLITTHLPRSKFTNFHYLQMPIMDDNDGYDAALLFLYYYHGNKLAEYDKGEIVIAKKIAEELGYLPLALACAGMYCSQYRSLSRFLDDYREDPGQFFSYVLTSPIVSNTLKGNWQEVYHYLQHKHQDDVAPLLNLCAFFGPAPIPEELLCSAVEHHSMQKIVTNKVIQQKILNTLQQFSLLELLDTATNKRKFSIHPVLQYAIRSGMYKKDGIKDAGLCKIAISAVKALNDTLPKVNPELQEIDYTHWQTYSDYLLHAHTCCQHIMKLDDVVALPEAIELLYKTGCFLTLQAKFAEAEKLLDTALESQKNQQQSADNSKELHLAAIELALGKLFYAQGLFVKARVHYGEAMKASPLPNEKVAILIQLEQLHDDLGKDDQARSYYEEAQTVVQTINPHTPLLDALLLSNQALLEMKPLYNQDMPFGTQRTMYESVERGLLNALTIFLNTDDKHPYTLECMANLVTFYILEGAICSPEWSKEIEVPYGKSERLLLNAKKCYDDVRKIGNGTLGLKQPRIAIHLNNLATLYYLQGKDLKTSNHTSKATKSFEDAQDAYKKAEEFFQESCPAHPMLAIILKNYATLLENIDADLHFDEIALYQVNAAVKDETYLTSNESLLKAQTDPGKSTGITTTPARSNSKELAMIESNSPTGHN